MKAARRIGIRRASRVLSCSPACAALALAALLLAPTRATHGFTKAGGSLSTDSQRDFRVHDNFADVESNDNDTTDDNWPGYVGAELALWKAAVEWGNRHGDGSGDPTQASIGDGGANFDAYYAGTANDVGTTDENVMSALSFCGGGTLAFTETPICDGWRIRFCDSWVWEDGPGTITVSNFDLQNVACHEYGHALGLGHSTVAGSTMFPANTSGSESERSIELDDQAGIQCIYGVASSTKPTITSLSVDSSGATVTISGTNFDPTGNEVWFTNTASTVPGIDPRVRVTGVSSSNDMITVTIPGDAGPGGIHVRNSSGGHSSLSNSFPMDIEGGSGGIVRLNSISPSTVDALIPGTDQTVSLNGSGFMQSTTLTLNLTPIDQSRYTLISSSLITMDMPQVPVLGPQTITVIDGTSSGSATITVVAPASPKLEVGTGDVPNVLSLATGSYPVTLSGNPGSIHYRFYSLSNLASNHPLVSLTIGNNFTDLTLCNIAVIPASGYTCLTLPLGSAPQFATFYSESVALGEGFPVPVSNEQTLVIVP